MNLSMMEVELVMTRKWLGRDKIRCIILKEKGTKAEEKLNEFVIQSGLKRVVLIISYEVLMKDYVHSRCIENSLIVSMEARLDYSSVMRDIDSNHLREMPLLIA